MFDVPLMRSLLAVADTGGFTRAAERLHLTQSAVSAHIRRLEQEAGHRLLERTTRSVALTPAGERLAGYARSILALHEDARASLGAGRRLSGLVSVGLSEEMAKSSIIACLRRFLAEHGDVELFLRIGLIGELLPRLQAGELDIVLGSRCAEDARGEVLWSEPLIWAAGPAAMPADDPSQPVPLAVYPDSCPYRAAAVETLSRAGRDWRIACQSPSAEGLALMVAAGLGIAPMPRPAAIEAGLREVTGLPGLPDALFQLISAAKMRPAATLMLNQLRESAAQLSGGREAPGGRR